MENRLVLSWLYADVEEAIDFDGYNDMPWEEPVNEREWPTETCYDNGGSIGNDAR